MTKKMVVSDFSENLRWEIDSEPLSKVLTVVQGWIEEYGPDAIMNVDVTYDIAEVVLFSKREETDEEYAQRLNREQQNTAAQQERDRKEFERLKAKFGD